MNLTLNLKREYFDAIKSGEKKFEYRLANKYWKRRIGNKEFDKIVLMLGYPKRADESRRIERPWRGYRRIRIRHEQFGDERVLVFAIRVNESEGDNE